VLCCAVLFAVWSISLTMMINTQCHSHYYSVSGPLLAVVT